MEGQKIAKLKERVATFQDLAVSEDGIDGLRPNYSGFAQVKSLLSFDTERMNRAVDVLKLRAQ